MHHATVDSETVDDGIVKEVDECLRRLRGLVLAITQTVLGGVRAWVRLEKLAGESKYEQLRIS